MFLTLPNRVMPLNNNMRWKHNTRLSTSEDTSSPTNNTFPIIINSGEEIQQSFSNIKIVGTSIYFYGEITSDSVLELNKSLVDLDLKNQTLKQSLFDNDYNPVIHLHINTEGGDLFSAFSTTDTIRNLTSPVYTHIDGLVASAGTLISSIGAKRFIGKHAHVLIHQLSSETYGKFSDMESDMENCVYLMKVLKEFYKSNTKIPMKRLDELMKKDIYMNASECLSYGIVDEIR